jgi:hypothetical protein
MSLGDESVRGTTANIDPSVPLYRVIDATELAYLRLTGDYGSSPSRSGKYFALTLSGARAFHSHPINRGATITQTDLPQSIVAQAFAFWDPGRHGAGQSVRFGEAQLPMVYGAMTRPTIV